MTLLLGEREVHNGDMIDGSARVRTDGQNGEAQVTARTAAGGCGGVHLDDDDARRGNWTNPPGGRA